MRPHQVVPPQSSPELPAGATPGGLVDPLEVTLAAAVGAPAAARAAITVWMAGHFSAAMLVDAQLVLSELVANSVRHAEGHPDATVTVHGRLQADVLRLEVTDQGTGGSIARRAPDLQNGGGFGLNIVDGLARRWGVNRDAGTRVWVELASPAPAATSGRIGESAMHRDTSERTDKRHDAAGAAQRRADNARRRALAAREAAEQATTEYARRAHDRVADLHAQLAVSHEDFARTLRSSGDAPRQ